MEGADRPWGRVYCRDHAGRLSTGTWPLALRAGRVAAHNLTEKAWRHLDLFHLDRQRLYLLFKALILALVKSMPVAAVARLPRGA